MYSIYKNKDRKDSVKAQMWWRRGIFIVFVLFFYIYFIFTLVNDNALTATKHCSKYYSEVLWHTTARRELYVYVCVSWNKKTKRQSAKPLAARMRPNALVHRGPTKYCNHVYMLRVLLQCMHTYTYECTYNCHKRGSATARDSCKRNAGQWLKQKTTATKTKVLFVLVKRWNRACGEVVDC